MAGGYYLTVFTACTGGKDGKEAALASKVQGLP